MQGHSGETLCQTGSREATIVVLALADATVIVSSQQRTPIVE